MKEKDYIKMGTTDNYGSIEDTLLTIPDSTPTPPSPKPPSRTESTKQLWIYTGMMLALFGFSVTLGIGIPLAVGGPPKFEIVDPALHVDHFKSNMEEENEQIVVPPVEPRGLPPTDEERIQHILNKSPLIDGHNDLAWNLRNILNNQLERLNFSSNLLDAELWKNHRRVCHTDIPRLRTGRVGAQFWSAFVECRTQYADAVIQTLEQIDVIKRLAQQYSDDLEFVTTAEGIESAHKSGRIGSLIGVEGGHSIASSLGILRMFYELGVRYLTLNHNCNTPWSHSCIADKGTENTTELLRNNNTGLSEFGKGLVTEMNRLGMIVDLSHVSHSVMHDVLDITKAPVMFSHSSAFAICPHIRNVRDDVLERLKSNDGVVMVNFYNQFLTCGDNATMQDAIDHINHIRNVAGVDHIGFGADYDGADQFPTDLDEVSKYPDLLLVLLKSGDWSEEDIGKLAGRNILRVLHQVEKIRDELQSSHNGVGSVNEQWLPYADAVHSNVSCVSFDASFNHTESQKQESTSVSSEVTEGVPMLDEESPVINQIQSSEDKKDLDASSSESNGS